MSVPGLVLTEWARLLVGSLARAGVRRAVISPGSRSTPFAVAALREAGLECTSALDERCAAFFALGQSKVSGSPTLLICTSGSAGANYLPAVLEASLSHTPLLLLTADRPPELHDCGAPQTADQSRLFGVHARACVELGLPDPDPQALRGLARRAVQAVHTSLWPLPGPVQLNAPARQPLEPVPTMAPVGAAVDVLLAGDGARVRRPTLVPDRAGIEALASTCARARHGVIRCGVELPWRAAAPAAVDRLAKLTGFPVLAEWSSQLRLASSCEDEANCDAAALLLRVSPFAERVRPDLVLQIGGALLAPSVDRLLGAHTELHLIARDGWPDPSQRATSLLIGDLTLSVDALADALASRQVDPALRVERQRYRARWAAANQAAWAAVASELESATPGLDEGTVTRLSIAALPSGGLLALGNSLPIRHAEHYAESPRHPLTVLTQRGSNGIDGLVSAALGGASLGRPTLLLIGDVSTLHDAGGLALASAARASVAIVVIQNGGGRIFEQLPVAAAVDDQELPFWTTPHAADLAPLAALHRVRYRLVETREELARALVEVFDHADCTLIEARVPAHGALQQMERITAAVTRDLQNLETRS